jgi:hypothetical protein
MAGHRGSIADRAELLAALAHSRFRAPKKWAVTVPCDVCQAYSPTNICSTRLNLVQYVSAAPMPLANRQTCLISVSLCVVI